MFIKIKARANSGQRRSGAQVEKLLLVGICRCHSPKRDHQVSLQSIVLQIEESSYRLEDARVDVVVGWVQLNLASPLPAYMITSSILKVFGI